MTEDSLNEKYKIKHNKDTWDEVCPNCGNEFIEEVTGWCMNHHNPEVENNLYFCQPHPAVESVLEITEAYFCGDCEYIFDKDYMVDWKNYNSANCPVGKEIEPPDEESFKMQLQMGKKTMEEIDELIDKNCWKALVWIHSVLLRQLQYLFYFSNQKKELGHKRIDLVIGKPVQVKLGEDVKEHKIKWRIVENKLRYFDTTLMLCHCRSLIDEEFNDLKKFNNFRNKRIGHPDIYEPLSSDVEVQQVCRKGLILIHKLDDKLHKVFHSKT